MSEQGDAVTMTVTVRPAAGAERVERDPRSGEVVFDALDVEVSYSGVVVTASPCSDTSTFHGGCRDRKSVV